MCLNAQRTHQPKAERCCDNVLFNQAPYRSDLSMVLMVGVAGFEPTTPCPPDKCANRAALHSDGRPYSSPAAAGNAPAPKSRRSPSRGRAAQQSDALAMPSACGVARGQRPTGCTHLRSLTSAARAKLGYQVVARPLLHEVGKVSGEAR